MQRKAVLYDKGGDQHYDYISAWIKSTRGSDPDASLYYLAAMLEGGEDARFIARRMIILASEDIGNADPQALVVAVAAAQAVEHVGLPEGQYALAPGGDLPLARARSRTRPRARSGPRARTSPRPGPRRRPARCAPRRTRRRASWGAGRATSIRTARRATSTTRSTCPKGSSTCASTRPTTASRRGASGSRSCGGHAGVARPKAGDEPLGEAVATTRSGAPTLATRDEDPRIAAIIHAALGDARTVLNVGAGAGVLRAARPRGDRGRAVGGDARAAPARRRAVRRRDGGGAAVRRRRVRRGDGPAVRPPLGRPARRAAGAAPGRAPGGRLPVGPGVARRVLAPARLPARVRARPTSGRSTASARRSARRARSPCRSRTTAATAS